MIARTHDLAAITALGVAFVSLPVQAISLSTVILAIFANLIGGIAPDIDQPTAPFWRNLPIGKFFGHIFDHLVGGHRFLSHSLLGVALFGFLFYWLLIFLHPIMKSVNIDIVWWAFIIGMVSHLIADSFNKEGVPWLLPIPIRIGFPPIKAWRIESEGWTEKWIIFPGLLIFNFIYFFQNYRHVLRLLRNLIA